MPSRGSPGASRSAARALVVQAVFVPHLHEEVHHLCQRHGLGERPAAGQQVVVRGVRAQHRPPRRRAAPAAAAASSASAS
eukprot:CAMPEP_0197611840 /NCGR_PEP_ID=MMETSP1326-20131121/56165_1 /TAXON_ID=1155430 /ORGANISM="Genus nov. species nov., Strain RCC2288" /LENGTH=79 /DNA_ID=CAMNT_0043180533 /DNA_START=87 /DNA_END=323 /DNA_ORIENTATION=+